MVEQFVTLWVVIDPIGTIPVFVAVTASLDTTERRKTALVAALTAAGIESRPVVTGNFLKNPVIDKLPHNVGSTITAADQVDVDGLFVGNHHFPIPEQIAKLAEVVRGVTQS